MNTWILSISNFISSSQAGLDCLLVFLFSFCLLHSRKGISVRKAVTLSIGSSLALWLDLSGDKSIGVPDGFGVGGDCFTIGLPAEGGEDTFSFTRLLLLLEDFISVSIRWASAAKWACFNWSLVGGVPSSTVESSSFDASTSGSGFYFKIWSG